MSLLRKIDACLVHRKNLSLRIAGAPSPEFENLPTVVSDNGRSNVWRHGIQMCAEYDGRLSPAQKDVLLGTAERLAFHFHRETLHLASSFRKSGHKVSGELPFPSGGGVHT